jgi:hypothetical protein
LAKVEAVLMFDEKDFEVKTGIKSAIETQEDRELLDELMRRSSTTASAATRSSSKAD